MERLLETYAAAFHVRIVEAGLTDLHEQYGIDEARLVILRPDGHVAFVGDPGDLDGLAAYLDPLFGTSDTAIRQPHATSA